VYRVAGGEPGAEVLTADVVELGVTDGMWTEVRSKSLTAGTSVVTEQRDKEPSRRKFMGLF
jgi:hypothetical protein